MKLPAEIVSRGPVATQMRIGAVVAPRQLRYNGSPSLSLSPQEKEPPLLITAVGSYPRIGAPGNAPNLRIAIHKHDNGQLSDEELHAIERQVTEDVLEQQDQAGVELVTDGQVRWDDGQTYFARGIPGFTVTGLIRYFDTNTYYRQPEATSPVSWGGPISVDDYAFAKKLSAKRVKAVITGPYTLARLSRPGAYGSVEALARELAGVLNQEAKALEQAGAGLVQFDEPAIGRWKEDFALLHETSALVTKGLTAKTAIYTWFRDVADLAPDFFHLPYQVIGLDFVWGPRNWEALSQFPSGKELGLGIMDGRNTRLEPVDELVEGVRRASEHVSLDRIHLNPSCGLDYLPRQKAYDKLARLAEAGRAAQRALA